MRLADWPRNPYLNDELREWVILHLATLGVEDKAVYALAAAGQDEERRVLVATDVGLLDSWYAPRGSTARFSLSVRLYPWPTVAGVDLRGETFRLWAHEHQSRWRLRLARPALDTMADTPELGRALAEFAAICSMMVVQSAGSPAHPAPEVEDAVPAFLGRAAAVEVAAADADAVETARPAILVESDPALSPARPQAARPPSPDADGKDTIMDLERRLGLRDP